MRFVGVLSFLSIAFVVGAVFSWTTRHHSRPSLELTVLDQPLNFSAVQDPTVTAEANATFDGARDTVRVRILRLSRINWLAAAVHWMAVLIGAAFTVFAAHFGQQLTGENAAASKAFTRRTKWWVRSIAVGLACVTALQVIYSNLTTSGQSLERQITMNLEAVKKARIEFDSATKNAEREALLLDLQKTLASS